MEREEKKIVKIHIKIYLLTLFLKVITVYMGIYIIIDINIRL